MGEVEFFDKMKKINRLLSNEARESIWNYALSGDFVPVKALLEAVGEGNEEKLNKEYYESFDWFWDKVKGEENG